MLVDGVKVTCEGLDDFTEAEAENYIEYVRSRVSKPLKSVLHLCAQNWCRCLI